MKSAITKIFSVFILASYISFCGYTAFAADTASILPPAKTTFFDQNGKPLTAGTVDYYIPGTFTRKTTWQDAAETVPNTNPVVLDAAGRSLVLGSGSYRQIVKDKNGNTIWDQVTSSVGSGSGGGTAVGDGLLVGSTMPWAGFIAPPNWAFAYGQEIARTTYPNLLAAITSVQAVFCTNGSPILTGLSDTTQLPIGAKIEVSCLASNSTIISKTSSTVTASNNALTSTNTNATFFPWGNGNATTTFNLPDLRGVTLAGRPNMGGTDKGNLTTAYFLANPLGIGISGGSESQTLDLTQIPSHNHSGVTGSTAPTLTLTPSISSLTSIEAQNRTTLTGGLTQLATTGGFAASGALSVDAHTHTVASAGGGLAHSIIQPTTITNYIIKVTPDVSAVIASGVASLGGMTGVIACGIGVTCSSNTISALASPYILPAPTSVTLGGVFSSTVTSNQFVTGIDLTGAVTKSQPAFTDISGLLTLLQIATQAGDTVLANITSGSAKPTAAALPSCGSASSALAYTLGVGFSCNTISGSGTVNSGTINQMAYYAATGTAVSGNPNVTISTAAMRLGVAGSAAGTLLLSGSGSGTVTLAAQATAGTPIVTWGTSSGTPAVTASAPLAIASATGNITISAIPLTALATQAADTAVVNATGGSAAPTAVALGSCSTATSALTYNTTTHAFGCNSLVGTVTSVGWTGGIVSIATATSTPAFTIAGTSGGVPYFSSSSTWASSAALAANAIVVGGGAGVAPSTITTGSGVNTALGVATGSAGAFAVLIAKGTSAMGTSAISSATCATVVTTSATNVATTDTVNASFNGDPTAVTGYVPLTTGMLTIIAYPTANNVNFKVCNNTASSITPTALTLNWIVVR